MSNEKPYSKNLKIEKPRKTHNKQIAPLISNPTFGKRTKIEPSVKPNNTIKSLSIIMC